MRGLKGRRSRHESVNIAIGWAWRGENWRRIRTRSDVCRNLNPSSWSKCSNKLWPRGRCRQNLTRSCPVGLQKMLGDMDKQDRLGCRQQESEHLSTQICNVQLPDQSQQEAFRLMVTQRWSTPTRLAHRLQRPSHLSNWRILGTTERHR